MYQKQVNELILRFPWANKRQIAAMSHCSEGTVRNIINKDSIPYKPKTRFKGCSDIELFHSLVDKGLGIRRIAKEMNSTKQKVYYWTKYYNVPTKTFFWIRKAYIPKEQLFHLYHTEELTLAEISEVYDNKLSTWCILRYMQEYGIPRNEPGNLIKRDKLNNMVTYNVEEDIGEVSDGILWLEDGEDLDAFF